MRGEYFPRRPGLVLIQELPPRARRIHQVFLKLLKIHGTTSACAENTSPHPRTLPPPWNYLRVRGEYAAKHATHASTTELPPRARRILGAGASLATSHGTTSACAENTNGKAIFPQPKGNYLRVRGEYSWRRGAGSPHWELPPRARRIPEAQPLIALGLGTTSACAENTTNIGFAPLNSGNYLRVRGEYL